MSKMIRTYGQDGAGYDDFVDPKPDYLAVIPVGGGSSWGRASNKEDAIKIAVSSVKDWGGLFEVSGVPVKVNVVDVSGYGDLHWGVYPDGWLRGVNEETGKEEAIKRTVEVFDRTTPKWRKRG